MRDALVVAGAAVSSLLTTIWHHAIHRHREIKSHRELCNHQWGETYEVGGPAARMGGPVMGLRMYKQNCPACGEQKHVNADGSDYIPTPQRKEEDWIE